MEKTRECLRQDSRTIWEAMKQLDEKMVRQRKEPERRLVTYRLESASKAVVTTASALFLALIVSVWTNCNQYRTNRLLKDADLKYRAIRICLPGMIQTSPSLRSILPLSETRKRSDVWKGW